MMSVRINTCMETIHGTSVDRLQTCQPSRFWRDSPAFLPDVPRPAKSWKCPAFCTKSDFITQLNVITEIPFNFSQKLIVGLNNNVSSIPNGTAAESPCYRVIVESCFLHDFLERFFDVIFPTRCVPLKKCLRFGRSAVVVDDAHMLVIVCTENME